ncbi:hypothetical protein ATANTOWER_017110 [Ataeniobius toweri]|uniref:Uncharacterized protein n=1 Tax=Ataeniobius toweri TaxID=208326 RepID=A0ABU7B787_9TELE|nr:hypothetical protein [Ataeniobius toweri]
MKTQGLPPARPCRVRRSSVSLLQVWEDSRKFPTSASPLSSMSSSSSLLHFLAPFWCDWSFRISTNPCAHDHVFGIHIIVLGKEPFRLAYVVDLISRNCL